MGQVERRWAFSAAPPPGVPMPKLMKSSTTAEPASRKNAAPHVESAADPSIVIRAKMRQRRERDGETRSAEAARPRPAAETGKAEPIALNVSAEEGMRYYTAILGREPVLDPTAPDVFAGMNLHLEEMRSWRGDLSRIVRGEIARQLQLKLDRQATWRELMEAMTQVASRRIEEARQRLRRRNAA